MNKVLTTTYNITKNAKFVEIDFDSIDFFCENNKIYKPVNWVNASPISFEGMELGKKMLFLIILDAISFCYWPLPKWHYVYKGLKYDGSWAMIIALYSAIENNENFCNFNYLQSLNLTDFKKIFCQDTELCLLEKRLENIKNVSCVFINKYASNPISLLEEANFDSITLLELITTEFESFQDFSYYKGEKVFYCKRAQLLISDFNSICENHFNKQLKNIDFLSGCADYKIPYILREFNILKYCETLRNKIDNRIEIEKDSEEENEIRANTIWAIEYIKEMYQKKSLKIRSNQINDFLWLFSQVKNPNYKPYHLTITNAY